MAAYVELQVSKFALLKPDLINEVNTVVHLVLKRSKDVDARLFMVSHLASHDGLHEKAQIGEESQTPVLDLLHLLRVERKQWSARAAAAAAATAKHGETHIGRFSAALSFACKRNNVFISFISSISARV